MTFINEAELKATEDGFNSMPTKRQIAELIKNCDLEVVDIDPALKEYWQNAEDTVVVMLPENQDTYSAVLTAIKLGQCLEDEIHAIKKDGRIIIRMWWD